MPDWLIDLVGVLGFLVAAILAWIRVDEWRSKADLRLDMDWIVAEGEHATLRIVASNRGDARGGVRDIIFSPSAALDPDAGFYYLPMMSELPVMLDPGNYRRFNVLADPNASKPTAFERRLTTGGFTHAILIDADQAPRPFAVPHMPPIEPNRRSTYGRVSKR